MRHFGWEEGEYQLQCRSCVYWRKERSSNIYTGFRTGDDEEGVCTRLIRGKKTRASDSCPEGES